MTYINNYPFVLIFFLCTTFFVFFGIFLRTKIIKKICIVLSSLFFALFVMETILSFYMPYIIMKPIELYNKRTSYFPQKGKRYQVSEILLDNNNRNWFLVDKNYDKNKRTFAKNNNILIEAIYTIDENGLRYTKSNNNSNNAYLFLGCSFMFGACINDEETIPYLFSKEFNFEKKVINAGQDARGINRAYSILVNKDYLEGLLKKSKLKCIFYEFMFDHINRAFRYNMPSDILLYENGNEQENSQPFGIIKKYFVKSLIYTKWFSDFIEQISYNFYIKNINNTLKKMYNISKEYYGADFIVIMWSSNKDIEKYLAGNNVNFIKAYEVLNDESVRLKYDIHPSIVGNKKVVDLITNYLNKKGEV